jgi:hypothetical protein
MPTINDAQRPATRPMGFAIRAVAASLSMAALIAFVVGTALLLPGGPLDRLWQYNRPAHAAFQSLGRVSGPAFLALGLVVAATAGGLMRGRRWAWRLAVAIFAVSGSGDVFGMLITRDILRSGSGILVAAVFLAILLSRKVKSCFRR